MLASLKSVILPGGKTSLDSDGQLVEKEADMVDLVNGSRGTAGTVGKEEPQHEDGIAGSFFSTDGLSGQVKYFRWSAAAGASSRGSGGRRAAFACASVLASRLLALDQVEQARDEVVRRVLSLPFRSVRPP